jgi:hypothetical protein
MIIDMLGIAVRLFALHRTQKQLWDVFQRSPPAVVVVVRKESPLSQFNHVATNDFN